MVHQTPNPIQSIMRLRTRHLDTRRRRIVAGVLAIVTVTLLLLGWYGWSVITALDDAQDTAVVELPPRSGGSPVASDATPTIPPENNPSKLDVAQGVFSTGTGAGAPDPKEVWTNRDSITFLVLGVDERPGDDERNADAIILARLDLTTKTLNAVSIPRDLEVEIPGHGPGKINGAYNLGLAGDLDNRVGGVTLMRDTIEMNFDVAIDEYILVNFDGFTSVVDALGGIDIDVPEAIYDPEYPTEDYGVTTFEVDAGPQRMDGDTALKYARTRSQDSDDARRERQMLVIMAIFDQAKDIGNLPRIVDIIGAVGGSVQTGVDFTGQVSLARAALEMSEDDIQMWKVAPPLVQPGTAANGAWIYVGDPVELTQYIQSALEGTLPEEQP